MQWVTPGIRDAFGPVEEALRKTFLLDLLQGLGEGEPGRGFTCLPVKQAGLSLPDPKKTPPENWTASCVIIVHLVAALMGPGGVPDGIPLGLPPRGTDSGTEAEHPASEEAPGGDHRKGPSPSRTLTAMCD